MTTRQEANINYLKAVGNGDAHFEGVPCEKHGHTLRYTSNRSCVECKSQYHQDNKGSEKEYNKQWDIDHKGYRAQYYQDNNEHIREKQKIYKSTPEFKKDNNEKYKKRSQEDPVFRTKHYLSRDVWAFYKLRGSKKEGRTHELLGYTPKECNDRIESLFQGPSEDHPKGMTWKNRNEWDIDHINPQSNFKSIDQLKECYALSNLKPEWKEWNLWKSNRFVGSSEEYPMPKKVIKK
jgi:hypothetical protein